MAYADTIRTAPFDINDVADLIDGVFGASGPLGASSSWSPTLTGFSANPANAVYRYWKIGRMVILMIKQGSSGTSNTTGYTITLPFTAATIANMGWTSRCAVAQNNSAVIDGALFSVDSAGTVINVLRDAAATAWTDSGGKSASGLLVYEAAS